MHKHALAIIAAMGLSAWLPAAGAQNYPSKPVRMVVGFSPGGATDISARMIADKLTAAFGVNFVVDNRPGAAGNIGADIVAKASPDGQTMLMSNSTISIPSLFAKLPFDVKTDLIPLSLVAIGPSVLVVSNSLPVKDVKGLIAYAKAHPHKLSYGSGGVGNVTHLAMALFASMAGLDMVHVPYKGGAPSLIGLMGGEVQLLFSSIPGALPHIKAGRIRAIGVSIRERSQALPDVPTIAEAGVPGYYAASWYGLFLPAGTPSVRVNTLSKQIMASMKSPDVKTKMLKLGFEPVGSDPAEFARFLDEEIARWAKVVKMAGITPK